MKREKIRVPYKDDIHVFVAQLGKEAKKKCLKLIDEMREAGIRTIGALGKGAMKQQLSLADKFNAHYTLILGITEVREGTIIIRNMQKGSQEVVKFDQVIDELINKIGKKNLDKYTPGELLY
jgi:histidyl-tRNA synthetase